MPTSSLFLHIAEAFPKAELTQILFFTGLAGQLWVAQCTDKTQTEQP